MVVYADKIDTIFVNWDLIFIAVYFFFITADAAEEIEKSWGT